MPVFENGQQKIGADGEPEWRWSRDHGKWWGRYSAPPVNGKRRQPWIGPFNTETDAKKALRKILSDLDSGAVVPSDNMTVGHYLREVWLPGKKKLKPSTRESYEEAIDLYYGPGVGHIKLPRLSEDHLTELYEAMEQINALPEGEKPSEMLRRLLAARALAPWRYERPGKSPGLNRKKPLTPARIRRIHAVISSAMGTALKQKRITHDPTKHVELPEAKPTKPIVWTAERVERWRQTGKIPHKVMVWTPDQAGHFLDTCEKHEPRLYPMYHLVATRGLRRGEAAGAMLADLQLDAGTLDLLEGLEEDDDGLKSERSTRTVSLDDVNVALLRRWVRRQKEERLAAGEAWVDSGRLFTRPDGSAYEREEYFSDRFVALVKAADLPPIRFHDLRHCAATMMLAAGVDMKYVSAELGHARYAFTADVYASVLPDVARAAANATVAIIPRRGPSASTS
ncbi:site-specific integrase [Nonomuraea angiospora]|uniref:site-specific integrase n=1 Tax=Nonomuraea angiospora TaxID=46172 RepID=UPI00342D4439